MKKKILCIILAFAIFFPAPLLRADDGKQVKVIMKDGSIVSGELLGIDDGILMLQTKSGKSKEIPVNKIKKAFDADGKSLSLEKQSDSGPAEPGSGSSLREPSGSDDEEEQPTRTRRRSNVDDEEEQPSRSRRRAKAREPRRGGNGAKIAGIVLDIVGGLGFVGGMYVYYDGDNRMDNATSKYCPATQCTDGYYYYTIPGKPGYYKYSQYQEYYYGEAERNTGTVVMVVGGALLITGLILGAVGSSKSNEAGLMNLEDGKIAWSLPAMDYNPSTQKSKLTLLTAQF